MVTKGRKGLVTPVWQSCKKKAVLQQFYNKFVVKRLSNLENASKSPIQEKMPSSGKSLHLVA